MHRAFSIQSFIVSRFEDTSNAHTWLTKKEKLGIVITCFWFIWPKGNNSPIQWFCKIWRLISRKAMFAVNFWSKHLTPLRPVPSDVRQLAPFMRLFLLLHSFSSSPFVYFLPLVMFVVDLRSKHLPPLRPIASNVCEVVSSSCHFFSTSIRFLLLIFYIFCHNKFDRPLAQSFSSKWKLNSMSTLDWLIFLLYILSSSSSI